MKGNEALDWSCPTMTTKKSKKKWKQQDIQGEDLSLFDIMKIG
jgi:hypothetical protein